MPIVQTSLKSKNYNALGIDEIADDIENIITEVNGITANGLPGVADGVTITGTGIASDPYVAVGGSSYKVYTALMNQTGTSAPVATVLENTLSAPIVWTRTGVGQYLGTLTGEFLEAKYFQYSQAALGSDVFVNQGGSMTLPNGTNTAAYVYWRLSDDTIGLYTIDSAAYVDEILVNTPFEIRVYN